MAKGSWAWKLGRGLGATQHYVSMGPAVVVYAGVAAGYHLKTAAHDVAEGRRDKLAEYEAAHQAELKQKIAEAVAKADMNAADAKGMVVQVQPI